MKVEVGDITSTGCLGCLFRIPGGMPAVMDVFVLIGVTVVGRECSKVRLARVSRNSNSVEAKE